MVLTVDIGDITILQVSRMWYERVLNGISSFEVFVDGADATIRAQLETEKEVNFYRNGTLELKGEVSDVQFMQGGGVLVRGIGVEEEFTEEEPPIDAGTHGKVYTSTDDDTIFADLVGAVAGWTSNVASSSATAIDSFKTSDSMSVWQALIKLVSQTNKEMTITYSSRTIFLRDTAGSAAAFDMEEGLSAGDVVYRKLKPQAAKVMVYGKGEGSTQIVGSAGSGTPVKNIYDSNIISTVAANQRATSELSKLTQASKIYRFTPFNPDLDVELGDKGTLNAPSVGLATSGVDIVKIKRSIAGAGVETLSLEVTNPELRIASTTVTQENAQNIGQVNTSQSTNEGGSNILTFLHGDNFKSSSPINIHFELKASHIQDEAGNLNIDDFTLDYDIDPYRRGFSTSDAGQTHDVNSHNTVADGGGSIIKNAKVTGTTGTISDNGLWNTIDTGILADTSTTQGMFVWFSWVIEPDGTPSITGEKQDWGFDIRIESSSGSDFPSSVGNRIAGHSFGIHNGAAGAWDRTNATWIEVPVQYLIFIPEDTGPRTYDVEIQIAIPTNTDIELRENWTEPYSIAEHTHAVSTITDGAASKVSSLVVADDVVDTGSTNAATVDIDVEFWNGSAWINKLAIAARAVPANTIDTDIDISNGGTLPDAAGFWRVVITPDSGNADFITGLVKIKHAMDT